MRFGRKIKDAWNNFWFREVLPYSLAGFRLIFGAYLLLYFLRFAGDVELLFSSQGVYIPFVFTDPALPVVAAWMAYLGTLTVILLFILGIKTRIVTPLLLTLYLYYYFLNLAVINTAFDRLNIIFLAILCFARLDCAWSVSELGKSNSRPRSVSIWPIRIITIQTAFLYFGAGFWKLISPYWHTGEMMKWTLIGPWGTDLAFYLVRLNPPGILFDLLTWSVIAFELTVCVALFSKRIQLYAFVVGFLFHLSIALLFNIPEFMNCVCAYVLFVDPVKIHQYGTRGFHLLSKTFATLSLD